jgi:hypothetical protein
MGTRTLSAVSSTRRLKLEGVRGGDGNGIAERCRIYKWTRIIESLCVLQMSLHRKIRPWQLNQGKLEAAAVT